MRSQVADADEEGGRGEGVAGWKMWCDWSTVTQMGRRLEVGEVGEGRKESGVGTIKWAWPRVGGVRRTCD